MLYGKFAPIFAGFKKNSQASDAVQVVRIGKEENTWAVTLLCNGPLID